jgi:hypothetical protein
MNEARRLGLALCFLLAGLANAQEQKVLYTATVIANEAEVRSGAGGTQQLYPTNLLKKGERVEVVKELEGGWLAIKPPPGSFSWINARFVKQIVPGRPMYVVVAAPETKVPLLMGSNIKTDKPSVQGVQVQRGTQLTGVGGLRQAEDGQWLPVEPPLSEVRYIKADAVSKPNDVATGPPPATGAPPGPPGAPIPPPLTPTPAGSAAPPAPPVVASAKPDGTHPLWTRAQQEEQAGRYNEAIQLYRQLGAEVATTNNPLSMQAYNRAQWIADALRGRGGAPGTLTNRTAASPPTPPAGTVSSGPGWLRRAGRSVDLNMLYVLENSRGMPILYAVAQPGYSLDSYTNRNVELYGVRQYRADLRAYYMTVMQVRPLQ